MRKQEFLAKSLMNILNLYTVNSTFLLSSVFQLRSDQFKDPSLASRLIEHYKYSYEHFKIIFKSDNIYMASDENKEKQDIAYFYYRILLAYEKFFIRFHESISSAHEVIKEGIAGLTKSLQRMKEIFKKLIPDMGEYQEEYPLLIDQYILTAESEQDNKGYFNPVLDLFLPTMPKHQKFAFMMGMTPILGKSPEFYEKMFLPKRDHAEDERQGFLINCNKKLSELYLASLFMEIKVDAENKDEDSTTACAASASI